MGRQLFGTTKMAFGYSPKPEQENHNVSKESPFLIISKYVLAIALLFALLTLLSYLLLPFIPPERERAFFSGMDMGFGPANPKQTAYVQEIYQKIRPHLAEEDVAETVDIIVVCQPEYNAVTAPGMKIYLFSGLLEGVASENELAFILSHELSHAQHRDVLKTLFRAVPLQILSLAVGEDVSPLGVEQFMELSYSRRTEMRSDEEALDLLAESYGHTGGATSFFDSIAEREGDSSFLTAFSSHPLTSKRKKVIEALIKEKGYAQEETISLPKELFAHCQ